MATNPIGIMQGRLVPKYQGRYQCHPVGYWQQEFPLAKELGLATIEWVFEKDEVEANPLTHADRLGEIQGEVRATGVKVASVCTNYHMAVPLAAEDPAVAADAADTLKRLIANAAAIDARVIVLPCMENSSVVDPAARSRLVEALKSCAPVAARHGVTLALETELGPRDFAELVARVGSANVGITYDIGNSAAMGFDPAEELAAYGDVVRHVHIKDRPRGKGNIFLGTGDANYQKVFGLLAKLGYGGPLVMEAFRGEDLVPDLKRQLAKLREMYAAWYR